MPKRNVIVAPTVAALVGAVLCGGGCPSSGGSVTPAPVMSSNAAAFDDMTAASGLHYRWEIPGPRPLNIRQTIGNGCAFLDYDGDGNLDVLLVGPKPALYRGDGKGHFTDVSDLLGGIHGDFRGCAIGDVDNDGFPDIYLSGYHEGRLLHNEGGKRFADVTAASGLKPQPWGSSCAFVETRPGSGKLDLVVANYCRFGADAGIKQLCDTRDKTGKMVQTSCGPRDYEPLKGVFYRNLGGGRFRDATAEAGFAGLNGRGLGVAACDYDGSGQPAVAFANDEIGGDLMRPKGSRYENVSEVAGVAFDRNGNVHGGMGMDWGDYDNDGRPDLVVATFQAEPKSVYHNDGGGVFTDLSYPVGVGTPTLPHVAFGVRFFDYDNDGWLDLIFSSGHVQDNIADIAPDVSYRQSSQLFHNQGNGGGHSVTFADVTAANPALQQPIVGRGLAVGDFDNDGRLDVLIVNSEGEPLLLRNQSSAGNHWVGFRLIGKKANRDGYGAVVTVESGGRKLTRHCHADGSYLSSSDPRVHFGLGNDPGPVKATIRWPGGAVQVLPNVKPDAYTTVAEGSSPP